MEHNERRKLIRSIARHGAIPSELGPWLRQVRDALRTAGTKRRIPGRTADRQRARRNLRIASRWVTAAMRSLGNTQGLVTQGTGLSAENAPASRRHQ